MHPCMRWTHLVAAALLLLSPLPISSLSPFHKALVSRENGGGLSLSISSEVPLPLLHYSVSLVDPSMPADTERRELEIAFAEMLSAEERDVRLLTASLPKGLDLSELADDAGDDDIVGGGGSANDVKKTGKAKQR